jgi:hypothetical protein
MLLLGILIVAFVAGLVGPVFVFAFLLIGVGVVFSIMALLKARAPAPYEMSHRVTLAYGIIAIVIGLLWITFSVQAVAAGYVLAAALIFFGLVFLLYTKLKATSA